MNEKSIVIDNHKYQWNETEQTYFGQETSGGTHGATIVKGKWIPSYWSDGSYDVELSNESFNDLESALRRSYSYWL